MAGAFDDLIPAQPAQQSPQGFDDLIPQGDAAPQGNAANWGPTTEILNGAMMGTLPEAEGWVSKHLPQGTMPSGQQIQADRDAYAGQHPYISAAANMTGGAVPYAAAGEALAPAGMLARAMGMAGTGATLNGGAAAIKGEDPTVPAMVGAAAGAGGELASTALTGAGGKLADALLNRNVEAPSAAALKSASNAGYDALQTGPSAMAATMPLSEGAQFGQDTLDQLGNKWLSDTQAAKQFSALANPPPGASSVTAGGLETARQNLNSIIRQSPGTAEAAAATVGKQSIDDLVASKASTDPDWAQFASDASDARGNWAAQKRSATLTGALDKSAGAAEAGNGDLAGKLGQRANAILSSPRLSQGLTDDDQSALQGIRSGTPLSGLARAASAGEGKTLWGGALLGLDTLHNTGSVPAAVAAAVGPYAAGKLAQAGSGYFARGAMGAADEATRMNSPLFRQMVASGQSAAPVDVGPTQVAARKLAAALGAPALQQQGQQNAPQ
jgi:hypothetical protein